MNHINKKSVQMSNDNPVELFFEPTNETNFMNFWGDNLTENFEYPQDTASGILRPSGYPDVMWE